MTSTPEDSIPEPQRPLDETFDAQLAAEKLLDQFEHCWKRGEAPDMARYLAQGERLGDSYVEELKRIDAEYRGGGDHEVNREILFGLLAAQLQFASRPAIVEAVKDWLQDRRSSVGEILVRRGAFPQEQRELLEALTREQIKRNWGDIVQSIADLSSVTELLADLQSIQAAELKLSLDTVTMAHAANRSARLARRASGGSGSRFRIIKFTAKGGLGQVYLARDEELGREVALKEIQPDKADDEDNRGRFVLEAEITGGLEHPGIVPVYGLGFYGDGRPYYAMRFIRGNNLTSAIERFHDPKRTATEEERTLEFRQLLGRFVDVCQAIEYAHSRGVLHRDLKPGNIMLGKYGETLVVDWGLAKVAGRQEKEAAETTLSPASASGSAPTLLGSAIGTPQYMSPEQAAGKLHELGPATDVYSLGATLYHLLTGSPPFGKQSSVEAILELARAGKWPPVLKVNPKTPPALAAICEKAMALHPGDRFASVGLLAQDVEKWLADEPVAAYPEPLLVRARRWIKRHQTTVGIGSSVVLVLLAGSIIFALNKAEQNRQLGEAYAKVTDANEQLKASNQKERQARNEAEIRREAAELEWQFDRELKSPEEWNSQRLTSLHDLLKRIRTLSTRPPLEPKFFDSHRDDFLAGFKAQMQKWIDANHFDETIQQRFFALLSAFEMLDVPGAKEVAKDLDERGKKRISGWNLVVSEKDGPVPLPNEAVSVSPPPPVEPSRIIQGDFESRIELAPGWEKSKVVEISLRDDRDAQALGYKFLLLAPNLNDRDIADPERLRKISSIETALQNASPQPITIVIQRGGQALASRAAIATRGPLQLDLQRVGSLVTLRVHFSESTLEDIVLRSDDPFAPPKVREVLGVKLAEGQTASLTQLRTRRMPSEPSQIEQGDELFQKGAYLEARAKYLAAPESLERDYKLGITEIARGEAGAGEQLLNKILFHSETDANSQRWRRFANVKLLSQMVQNKNPTWETIRNVLERMKADGGDAELLRMLPKTDRDQILQEVGKLGLRFRLAFDTSDDLSSLELRRELDEWFNEDKAVRVSTAWRIADVYRFADKLPEAERDLRAALQLARGDATVERQLAADLSWLLTGDLGTSRDQARTLDPKRAQQALELLAPYLDETKSEQLASYYALLAERARIQYLLGQKQAARSDLQQLFEQWKKHPAAILYSEYAQARHLSALLFEEEGEKEQAKSERSRATVKLYYQGEPPTPRAKPTSGESIDASYALPLNGIAIALNGEAEPWEIRHLVSGHLPGSGLSDMLGKLLLRGLLESETARYGKLTAKEMVPRLVLGLYNTKRGAPVAREMILKQCSLSEYHRRPLQLILYEAVRLSSFDGQEIAADLEPLVWDNCQRIIDCYNHKLIVEEDLLKILLLWAETYSPARWNELKTKLTRGVEGFPAPPGLAESIAYVLAKNYLARGDEKDRIVARELLMFAKASANSPAQVAIAVDAELTALFTTESKKE